MSETNQPVIVFDAGAMGCGELLLQLKFKISDLNSGEIIKVISLDPGAPEDLPAWCGLTGHRLVINNHPEYWIEKKRG